MPILSFTPHENKLKQGKNANFKGFDRFSMTPSPSYERHFQTDEARELGLVSFWSILFLLIISKEKIVIWTNMIHVFSQKHGAMLNFYQIFLFYHWIIIQKSRMNIMNTQDMKSTKKELQFETNLTSVALTV